MLAMILAAYYISINLLGVSTSAGNSTIEYNTKNALDILYLIYRGNIEVIWAPPNPCSESWKLPKRPCF
jgi:inosine-uridine nucleoside N-ribohydrolase